MEELKRRLVFNNGSVQVQAVWKLYEAIIKNRQSCYEEKITNSTPPIGELSLLWEKCADSGSGVVLRCCSQALVQLVRQGIADWTYMLNGFLNLVPSSSNLTGIVSGLGELLVFQAVVRLDSGETYQCPYSIRLPTHPFITVLTNRPADSWPHLHQQILTICGADENQQFEYVAVKIIEPFLSFVLLEPDQRPVYEAARNGIQRTLLSICRDGSPVVSCAVLDYILQILPSIQINVIASLSNVCSLIYELCSLMLSPGGNKFTLNQTSSLLDYGLSIILHCQSNHSPDVSFLGEKLLALIQQYPKCASDLTLVCLSDILHTLAPSQATPFLKMAFVILNDSETSYLPHITGTLVPGLLVVMATPLSPQWCQKGQSDHSLALSVLKSVEARVFSPYSESKVSQCRQRQAIKSTTYEYHLYINLSKLFTKNPQQAHDWLVTVTCSISHLCNISLSLMNFVSSLLLSCDQVSDTRLIVDILVQAAHKHSNQAPMLLAVFQYALSRHTNPAIRLTLLTAVPRLATHKISVAPVLRFIHALRSSAKLRPQALHLMTLLWKQQPRIFPQLHQMFLQESKTLEDMAASEDDTCVNSVLLSQAQAAWQILSGKIEAVHSHGGDMLLPMSAILNVTASDQTAPAVALVLRCLKILCQQEVIDIQSTWQQIGAKFLQDTRCAVLQELCGLLAVVAQLGVNTDQLQEFEAYCVSTLWMFTFGDCGEGVSSAAFTALKHFTPGHIRISHLPEQITRDIIEQALTKLKSTCDIDEIDPADLEPDSLVPDVPAVCYAHLFTYIQPQARKGYGEFLQKHVKDEVLNMPRGVQFMAHTRHQATANQNKAVKNIPSFLQGQYEKTAQPGVRPGYVAGLLFCFELSEPECGRNSKPRPNDLLMRGRNYQEMFTRLLRECPIWTDDHQYCLALCDAWASFMDRAFTAILQGRQSELDMQCRHGQISEDEGLLKKASLWMNVRDRLTDLIKTSSKNSPGQQVSAVIALAGLAATVAKHVAAVETISTGNGTEEYQGQNHPRWIMVVMDTVMSLMDMTYMPTGPLLGLCQQRSSDDRIPPSSLCQAAACLAVSQLAPVCMTVDMDRVFDLLSLFRVRFTEALTDTGGDATLKLRREFLSLGLSLTISRLVQERFSDTAGTKGMLELWKGIHLLEDRAFAENHACQTVCMLSLGPIHVALCGDGQTDSRVHVQATMDKMMDLFKEIQTTCAVYPSFCLTLAQLTSAGVTSNILPLDQAHSLLDRLHQLKDHCTHAFATLSYCLGSISGGSTVLKLQHEVVATWSKQIHSDSLSTSDRLCLLSAIMTLAGIGRHQYTATQGVVTRSVDVHLIEVVKIATILTRSSDNLDLQHQACWQLGRLYQVSTTSVTSSASVPLEYSYLPQPSFLHGIVVFLQQASQAGPEIIDPECVQLALEALTVDVTRSLPPLNWAAVLSPLIRLGYGVAVNRLCLQLAVKQSCTSPTAATFISSWLLDPLFSTLPVECKDDLYKSLSYFVKCQPVSRLTEFLHQACMVPFKAIPVNEQHCSSVLTGLRHSLLMSDPPEAVVSLLYQFTETIYKLLSADVQPQLLCEMAECLCQLPDAVFDTVTAADFSQHDTTAMGDTNASTGDRHAARGSTRCGLYIRCYAVANGKQPITMLNGAIDAVLNDTHCDMEEVMYLLCSCCYQCCHSDSTLLGKMPRLQWLLEYLGHVNTMATEVTSLGRTECMIKRLEFGVCSICVILALWSSPGIGGVIGLVPDYFSCVRCSDSPSVPHCNTQRIHTKLDFLEAASVLRICATNVSDEEPWKQIIIKVVDWMYTLRQLPDSCLRPEVKQILADCSVAMRSAPELRANFHWVKAIISTNA